VTIDLDAETASYRSTTGTDDDTPDKPQTPVAATDPDPESSEAGSGQASATQPPRRDPAGTPGSAPAMPPRRSGGLLPGLAGGVIALLLGAAGQWSGLFPSPSAAPVDAVSQTAFAALEQRLETLAAANESGAQLAGQTLPQMQKQLDSLSQRLAAIDDITARIGKLEARPIATGGGAVPAEIGADIEALRVEIAALGRDIAEIRGSAKLATDGVAAAGDRLSALEAKAAQPGAGFDVATPIAAAALKSAIDRGGSFASELETYAKVTGDSETVDKLRQFAAAGIPSTDALRAEFSAVADAIIAAASPPVESGGLVGRLVDSARGLVRARPVGDVAGTTPDAIVARVEDRLAKGDVEAAALEFGALPEAASKPGEAFAKRLQARLEADRLIAAKIGAALATAGQ
jgi:hypothetical protein